ncbi:MAG: hypothetical protein QOD07_1377 [Frankiaceae bacterium]|jgi:hypothetical protein|nr:hypothetical protein [Frankiaceae bacterium]
MRAAARLATAAVLVAAPLLAGPAASSAPLTVAAPYGIRAGIPLPPTFRNINPIKCLAIIGQARKDRCRTSKVPSTVDDTEAVDVGVGPDGVPAVVTDRQQLVVHGAGNYLIYELGPARKADGLNEFSLPNTNLGQVVWQGFAPGTRPRTLAALLTLDPGIEANRLPMSIQIEFTDAHGKRKSLDPGGAAPVAGTAHITLVNATGSPRSLAVGTAALGPLAHALDTLLAAARDGRADVPRSPPCAGNGLPESLPGTLLGQTPTTVTAPLLVHGTITVAGATGSPVTGPPGTAAVPGGASLDGRLNTTPVTFDAHLAAGQKLKLDLDVLPWLDPRTFPPPDGAPTWTRWAATHPSAAAVGTATATFIGTAAEAARAADYSPYLQTDTRGQAASAFHYELAPEAATRRAGKALTAKPGAIVAACLAGLAIAGNAALLRRQW